MSDADDKDRVIIAREWVKQVCDALGLKKVRRIVIDAEVNEPIRIYVEQYGTRRLLDVAPPDPAGVQIIIPEAPE